MRNRTDGLHDERMETRIGSDQSSSSGPTGSVITTSGNSETAEKDTDIGTKNSTETSTATFIKEGISNVEIQNKLTKIEDDYATRTRIANKRRATKSLQVQLRKNAIKKQRLKEREIKKNNKFNRTSKAEKAYFEQIHQQQWQGEALEESEVREFEKLQQHAVREFEQLQQHAVRETKASEQLQQSEVKEPRLDESTKIGFIPTTTMGQVKNKNKKKKKIIKI